MEISLKLGIKRSYDPVFGISGISIPTIIERDTYILIFIAALFTIARGWMQSRRPSTEERIKKMVYIHTMEYYSAVKRNGFESVLVR